MKTLLCVLCLTLLTASCGKVVVRPTPVSVAPSALIKCQEMPDADSNSMDDYLVLEGIIIDLYEACALRHNEAVDAINDHNKEATNHGR